MKHNKLWLTAGVVTGAGALSYVMVKHFRRIQAESMAWQVQRRPALDVLACPKCHGALNIIVPSAEEGYHCPACQEDYPVVDGIPHFIQPQEMTGFNKQFAQMYDWFSWGYRLFSKIAFAYIGITE